MKKLLKKPDNKVSAGSLVVAYVNNVITGRDIVISNDNCTVINNRCSS